MKTRNEVTWQFCTSRRESVEPRRRHESDWMRFPVVQSALGISLMLNVPAYASSRVWKWGVHVCFFRCTVDIGKISSAALHLARPSVDVCQISSLFLGLRPKPLSPLITVTMTTPLEQFKAKLLNGPALPPPPGVTPNFVNPENLDNLTIAIFTLCMILATLTVILRMWTKICIIRQTSMDDCISSSSPA